MSASGSTSTQTTPSTEAPRAKYWVAGSGNRQGVAIEGDTIETHRKAYNGRCGGRLSALEALQAQEQHRLLQVERDSMIAEASRQDADSSTTPWLDYTRWPEQFAGRPLDILAATAVLPPGGGRGEAAPPNPSLRCRLPALPRHPRGHTPAAALLAEDLHPPGLLSKALQAASEADDPLSLQGALEAVPLLRPPRLEDRAAPARADLQHPALCGPGGVDGTGLGAAWRRAGAGAGGR
ncbi:hypothetical protein V491_00512 [Pseudogymnoascus sp. VKM F-3775]|nr:hypothetical protein V491_00512 [Pseudogymnoascus sp. VKM F-3775]